DDGERVRALHARRRVAHRFEEVLAGRARNGDEVREDLGVRLGRERAPRALELFAQVAVVLDDAVMDDGDAVRRVRVRVLLVGPPMGGPTRVSDAGGAGAGLRGQARLERRELAGGATHRGLAAVDGGDAGAVVAAVFEARQAVDEDGLRLLLP